MENIPTAVIYFLVIGCRICNVNALPGKGELQCRNSQVLLKHTWYLRYRKLPACATSRHCVVAESGEIIQKVLFSIFY